MCVGGAPQACVHARVRARARCGGRPREPCSLLARPTSPRRRALVHSPAPAVAPPPAPQLLGDLLKNLPADTLTSLLGASEAALDQLTKEAGQGGAMDECKKRCGLAA